MWWTLQINFEHGLARRGVLRDARLLERSVEEALFLGCTFADGDADEVRRRGGVVLPDLPGSPVDTYRTRLYGPRELYDTPRYAASLAKL